MQTTAGQTAVVIVAVLLSLPVAFTSHLYGSLLNFIAWLLSILRPVRFGGITVGAKKRRGYVFNNVSKRPLPLVLIKIFDYETSRLVYQTYANAQGEFVFKLGERKCFLEAYRAGYIALAAESKGKEFTASRSDGYYERIYYIGEVIDGKNEIVDLSIPMNPAASPGIWAIILRTTVSFLRRSSYLFLFIGTVSAIAFFALAPSFLINILILIYYFVVWSLLAYLAFTHPKRAGDVLDLAKVKLPQALVRVFDKNERLVQTAISDDQGEFVVNISKGEYEVEARKAGFKPKRDILKVETLRDVGKKEIRLERP